MIVDTTNAIANHKRYQTRDIHKTIRSLSNERKQKILDEIQLHKSIYNLTGREYNHENCNHIESLLSKNS